MNVCYKVHISGKVQGVYFRSSAQQQAIDYSISGYARNLSNGDVEVLLCGEQSNIDNMLAWLAHGPEQAEVDSIDYEQVARQEHHFFSIG
ncbi:acylphosphatase [Colwellia sp. D2M02]|uniref:Acylphosphatase n=1 Tax=Colwellia asteriadis TaxID=517723 RepID=A0ABN1L8G3_9GAMM|nr:acylphosphatase [Colwellia sp. D2M02]MBU2893867.1 acylphosphatase [Colwellia sp. D2M02]